MGAGDIHRRHCRWFFLPTGIKSALDDYVVGQNMPESPLRRGSQSLQAYCANRNSSKHVDLQKGNILMIGSTGPGKHCSLNPGRILHVPLCDCGCHGADQAGGYVGEDVENIVLKLLPELRL